MERGRGKGMVRLDATAAAARHVGATSACCTPSLAQVVDHDEEPQGGCPTCLCMQDGGTCMLCHVMSTSMPHILFEVWMPSPDVYVCVRAHGQTRGHSSTVSAAWSAWSRQTATGLRLYVNNVARPCWN
eukprot:364197-Chlamydomonas_euryale.AAC.27